LYTFFQEAYREMQIPPDTALIVKGKRRAVLQKTSTGVVVATYQPAEPIEEKITDSSNG